MEREALGQSSRALDTLRVKLAAAGGYQEARSALSKALAEQKEEVEMHLPQQRRPHYRFFLGMMYDKIVAGLVEAEDIIIVLVKNLSSEHCRS